MTGTLELAQANVDMYNENRKLKHELKVANKSVGRQGETIHRLRAEIAEVRSLNSRIERGELRYQDRAKDKIAELSAANKELATALRESDDLLKVLRDKLNSIGRDYYTDDEDAPSVTLLGGGE